MSDILQEISSRVGVWPQVTIGRHRFGGTEYLFAQAEIGHLHRDGTLDIPFPMPVRNQLLAERAVEKHHFLPESGWITFHVTAANGERALWLLRLSYLRYALREAGRGEGWDAPAVQALLEELSGSTSAELRRAFQSSLRLPSDDDLELSAEQAS